MTLIIGIVIFAAIVAMLICIMKYSSGKLRKFVWRFNIGVVCAIIATSAVYMIASAKIKSDEKNYDIRKGTVLSGYGYRGETVPGYYEIVRSGLFYAENILIPKENVQVSPFSRFFVDSCIYVPKGDLEIKCDEERLFISPWNYYVATNIVKIAPNPGWMTLEIVIYILMLFAIVNVVLFILVLVQISKKDKENSVNENSVIENSIDEKSDN